jgi:16S rRNA processing protein RimM
VRVIVARVGRPHGIRGEVTVDVRTDSPDERFVPGAVLYVVPAAPRRGAPAPSMPWKELTITGARDHNGTMLLRLSGIEDRSTAEQLHGVLLEVDVPESSDEDDAWYPGELVGLRVESPEGRELGEVTGIDPGAAQDLLTVRCLDGRRRLVPFVSALVPVVDVAGGRIVVAAPPGLLDDGDVEPA